MIRTGPDAASPRRTIAVAAAACFDAGIAFAFPARDFLPT
jgi:hypothetical protein